MTGDERRSTSVATQAGVVTAAFRRRVALDGEFHDARGLDDVDHVAELAAALAAAREEEDREFEVLHALKRRLELEVAGG